MATNTATKPSIGDVGIAVSKPLGTNPGDSTTVSVINNVGGFSSLPEGRYPVRITRFWDQSSRRLVGELIFPKHIEIARKAGTTTKTAEDFAKHGADQVARVKKALVEFDPKLVCFQVDNFETDGSTFGNTKIVNGAVVTEIPIDTSVTNDQLEKQGHKYAVTKIKTFRGRDGYGLNATLTRDGKAIAFVLDEGCGGMVDFDWDDQKHGESAEEAMFKGFIASLPPDPEDKDSTLDPRTIEQFAMERWVNAEVDRITNDKRLRKACKTKTLFQVGAEVGGDEFRVIKGPALPNIREYIQKKYKGQKVRILNDEFKD